MRKITLYLTILFLLLIMSSCTAIKRMICGTELDLRAPNPIPDTALCIDDARTMEQNYMILKDFYPTTLGSNANEHDNRIISFTYQQMKDNIEYLTREALKSGIPEEKLGFRVYFAAKKNEPFNKGELKTINRGEVAFSTVFFVATKKGATEDENDYINIYEIPALNYGGSRRPPNNPYNPDPTQRCPLIGTKGHNHY